MSLTIKAHQTSHRLSRAVLSKAPGEYWDSSKAGIGKVTPVKDPLVAKVRPDKRGEWSLKSPANLRGSRV